MLLNLAPMKLWHLTRQHVNFVSGVGPATASLSPEDEARAARDRGNERFMEAGGKKRMRPGEWGGEDCDD